MFNTTNLKSFFRFLGRNKTYTAIEIFGLSISLMFVILISVYTVQESSTDHFHENADRIYLLGNEAHLMSAYGIADRVKERYPDIEDACTVTSNILFSPTDQMPVSSEGKFMNAKVQFANDNFFRFFSFKLISGNKDHVLAARNDAVISQTFAYKMFEGQDPIGKTIQLNDSVWVTVSGIMKDIHQSMIPYSDLIVPIENLRDFRWDMDGNNFNNALNSNVFLLEKEGASLASKADDMRDYFKSLYWFYEKEVAKEVRFIPLKDAYFSDYFGYMHNKGDKKTVLILMTVAILILLFAVINYINLTVAQTGFRAKEIATRWLLGSSRFELLSRLIMESILMVLISFLIGAFLSCIFAPYANALMGTNINLIDFISFKRITILLLAITCIGIISGILPTILVSKTKAIQVVKGTFRMKTKMIFSKFFITFQNTITISLLAATLIMTSQINHLISAPLGYNTKNIIDIPTVVNDKKQETAFINDIKQLASVSQVALSRGTPFSGGNNHTIEFEGRNISFQSLMGDTAFVNMLGIEIIRENHISSDNAYYLSESALKEQNLTNDATTFQLYGESPIAGVIKNFKLRNILTDRAQPILLQISKMEDIYFDRILVEIQGDPYNAYQDVKQVYERITQLDFHGKFLDQEIEESFAPQKKLVWIISIFSMIAILLSLLGLFAMSTYFIQQCSREIGVRKVFGSTNLEILNRLIITFLRYVFIAFIIATPLIWYIMKNWLADYSYRISLTPVFFIQAGLFCLLVSFLTIFWQSFKAANDNPVNSIKIE